MRHYVFGRANTARIQFFRYFFVGGTSAVLDLIIYTALLHFFGLHYFVAAFIAYMLGLTWNHLLCLVWVFESKHSRTKEITMVVLIAIGGLLWTELILYGLIEFVHMHAVLAKMVSQILVLIWNFSMRKAYVFH
jgi:dolichol-phosphate mannosyltransferase